MYDVCAHSLLLLRLFTGIIGLFANCKGGNLGVVRLFHLLKKGNQLFFYLLVKS